MLHRMLPVGMALALAGFAACASEDNPRPSVGVDQSNLCSAVADVACYNMFRCCTGQQIEDALGITQSTSVEECRRDVKLSCEDALAPVYWSVDRGATTVLTAAYESCLEALVAPEEGCFLHHTEYPWYNACNQPMFQGNYAASLPCVYDHECLPSHYCGSNAKCAALPLLGQACPQFVCAAGMFCSYDTGNCEGRRSSGMSCDSDSMCQDGLFCGDSGTAYTCQVKRAVGVGCASNGECTTGYCIPGVCDNGDPCYTGTDCGGTCSATANFCYDDYDCERYCSQSGYYCTSDLDCNGGTDICPVNTCEGDCNGQPVCGEQYLVVDYCEDALDTLLH